MSVDVCSLFNRLFYWDLGEIIHPSKITLYVRGHNCYVRETEEFNRDYLTVTILWCNLIFRDSLFGIKAEPFVHLRTFVKLNLK